MAKPIYLFDRWECYRIALSSRGGFVIESADDEIPDGIVGDGACVFEGRIIHSFGMTPEECDKHGIPHSAAEHEEWWIGVMRTATDAEILAVLSQQPTTEGGAG